MEYLNTSRNIISETKAQYALLIHNRENLCNIPDSEIQFIVNDQLFLETLLLEIRAKTLSYSSFKKKEQDKLEKNLIAEIKILEEKTILPYILLLKNNMNWKKSEKND